MKRMMGMMLAVLVLMSSFACAETAVDIIMNTGTTQSFTDEAVSSDDLETILRAGLAAASAINQQPWFFVAVTDPDVMKELAGSGAGPGAGFTPPAGMGEKPEGAPEGMPGGDAPAAMPAGGCGAKASLGDSPAAIIIYRNDGSKSPNADFDCGLAAQNMVIAAASLGYGVKIVSSPTMTLNGANHDALCEKLGVDPSMQAVVVLLIGKADSSVDATSGATTRESLETKTSIIR
ncbi:MAG: nitroreductase family protein [Clostridia bacterium]|nr:nitroreductase family protein [Clostridia bacterium]